MTKLRWSPRPLRLPEIIFIAEKIDALPERDRFLARSLIGQVMQRGSLSNKQLRHGARLAAMLKPTRRETHTA